MENVPWPSSLKVSSRFSLSDSFLPLLLFLPPCLIVTLVCVVAGSFRGMTEN